MVLKDILAISGEPGLFKFIAQGKNAIIVEHLETKKRSSAYGSAKISSLEDIAIFTEKEDMTYYLPNNVMQGAINELKKEIELLKNESKNMQNMYMSILSLILATIAIIIAF